MAGVYLSYPFCAQKCTFCNFASGVAPDDVQRRYERMLLREIERHDWKWLPETIYWGGGTPSLMPLDEFADAMRAIPAAHIKEATLECAPGSVTADRAQAWRAAGINRVSLGVQSFVEAEARRTGRKHSAEIVERELNMLANVGISNINIDLIAGLPGQTIESWQLRSIGWNGWGLRTFPSTCLRSTRTAGSGVKPYLAEFGMGRMLCRPTMLSRSFTNALWNVLGWRVCLAMRSRILRGPVSNRCTT